MPTNALCLTTTPPIFGRNDRVRHSIHQRPPKSQTVVGGALFDPEMRARLRNGEISAAYHDPCDIAPVSWLIFKRDPFAVRWRVTSLVVNPLYRSAARCLAHVGDKLVKRCPPCFANCDAFCSVVFETVACRLLASPDHPSPDFIGAFVARLLASAVSCNQLFGAQAPATQRLPKAKTSSGSDNLGAAVAKACPRCRCVSILGATNNSESAKAMAFQINSGSRHGSR